MDLVLPKTRVLDLGQRYEQPTFYLGGPIRGGGDWQAKAIGLLMRKEPDALIFCPSRYTESHALFRYRLAGDETFFKRQTDWESRYMGYAAREAKKRCLIFWLPCESESDPRPKEEGPYAQDTYRELGFEQAVMRHERFGREALRNTRIIIGADAGFFGLRKLVHDYHRDVGNDFVFASSLEETVERAHALALGKS